MLIRQDETFLATKVVSDVMVTFSSESSRKVSSHSSNKPNDK